MLFDSQFNSQSNQGIRELKLQYDIDNDILGEGGFGKVFSATNRADNSIKVAIKVVDKSKLSLKGFANINNEVQMMQNVDHPNIVKYYETYNDLKYLYIVMEKCEGGEIGEPGDIIRVKKVLNESYLSSLVYKLLLALQHCHGLNIIHRDIKPSNIMYNREGEIKILDFGVAVVRKFDEKDKIEMSGTPVFLAPEV